MSFALFAYHSSDCSDVVTVDEKEVATSAVHSEGAKIMLTLEDINSGAMSRIIFVLVLLCVSKVRTKHLTAGLEANSKTIAIILQALGWEAEDTARLSQEQKRCAMVFIYHAFHSFDFATALRHALPGVGCNITYNLYCLLTPLKL
eukprot:2870296-Amphidinium_carterae.1